LQILSAFSDGLYVSPSVYSAGTFARKSKNTFFYHFAHRPNGGPYAAVSVHERLFDNRANLETRKTG
jgi:hypothetical protein